MPTDLTDRLTVFAEKLADESRAILNAVAGSAPEVDIKSDLSYVTATDRRVEERLREMIEHEFPEHGICGEEFGSRDLDAEYVWVLDPIDGTAAYVAGIPVYGVSGLFNDVNDVRAHGQDERISTRSFYEGLEFLYRLVKTLSSAEVM